MSLLLKLPFQAVALIFKRPRLFVLGVFPGLFTFGLSAVLLYLLWLNLLAAITLWIVLPLLMLLFLILWIVLGKIALLPVEDSIIDECQRSLWQEVRLPALPFSFNRIGREVAYSLAVGVFALSLLLLTFVPPLAILNFILVSWLGAYSFLSAIYSRKMPTAQERLRYFFRFPIAHLLLGAFLNTLLFVPVLNVFLLGYAQVITTLLYFHQEEKLAATD